MIGRSREVGRVEALLRDGAEGVSAALVVSGEPGIGKTELLGHARRLAAGALVLEASGSEAESSLAFAGLRDLLGPVLHRIDELPPSQAEALKGALALGPPRPGDRFTVAAATLSLLAAASEDGPVVCIIDDAHWLDTESLEAIQFAARRIVAEGVVILMGVRDGANPFTDDSPLERLRLEGLSATAAGRLVARRAPVPPDPAVLRALVEGAAGNPLALIELAGSLSEAQLLGREPLPDPLPVGAYLERALLRGLEDLPPRTRRALVVASADDGAVALLAGALAATGLAVEDLDPAERAGLIQLGPTRAAFSHPLLRAAVYQAAAAPDRRAAHRALAEAARARGDATALDRRAWHLALAVAGPDEEAARELEAAAGRAAARNGHAAACEALEAAARLSADPAGRGRRLLAAGQSALAAGDLQRAGRLFDEVAGGGDPAQVTEAMVGRGYVESFGGSALRAVNLLVAAAERLIAVSPEGAAALLVQAAIPAILRTDFAQAAALIERAGSLAPDGPADLVAYRDVADAVVATCSGHPREPSPQAVEELRRRSASGDPRASFWSVAGHQVLMFMERYEEAGQGLDASIRAAREHSSPSGLPLSLFTRAELRRRTGRLDEAAADATECVRLAHDVGQAAAGGAALWTLARIEAVRGQAVACRSHVDAMLSAQRASDVTNLTLYAEETLGLLALGEGRPEEAVEHFGAADRRYREMGVDVNALLDAYLPDLGEALIRAGRLGEAEAVVARLDHEARHTGASWTGACAHRCRGLMAGDDAFEDLFAAALEMHDRTTTPFERARTELCLGERLRRARRNREAREPLAAALATFDSLGARPWAEWARRELTAAGAKPAGPRPALTAELTPQELQVALAVATGATNKEVATALLISPKTVEYHLARVYGKLGVRSRAELAARMAREIS